MKAVFIVGEQRSGSNLHQLMLAQAGISAPHLAHLLTRMMPPGGVFCRLGAL